MADRIEPPDPFKILKLNRDTATIQDVKSAYNKYVKMIHPDKQKTEEDKKKAEKIFKTIKIAAKLAKNQIEERDGKTNGSVVESDGSATYLDLKKGFENFPKYQNSGETQTQIQSQASRNPQAQANERGSNFNLKNFNDMFKNNRIDNGYVMGVSEKDYVDKSVSERLSERSRVDNISIQPMFNGERDFDRNVFHRMFEIQNGSIQDRTKAMEQYVEPEQMTSGLQAYSEIKDDSIEQSENISGLNFSNIDKSLLGAMNPQNFDREIIEKLRREKDITNAKQIEKNYKQNIDRKLSEYTQQNIAISKPTSRPDFTAPINSGGATATMSNKNTETLKYNQELTDLIQNMKNMQELSGFPQQQPQISQTSQTSQTQQIPSFLVSTPTRDSTRGYGGADMNQIHPMMNTNQMMYLQQRKLEQELEEKNKIITMLLAGNNRH